MTRAGAARSSQTLSSGKGAVAGGFVLLSGSTVPSRRTAGSSRGGGADRAGSRPPAASPGDELWMARECPALHAERSSASTVLIAGLATEQMLVEADCIAQPAVTT